MGSRVGAKLRGQPEGSPPSIPSELVDRQGFQHGKHNDSETDPADRNDWSDRRKNPWEGKRNGAEVDLGVIPQE